MKSEEPGGSRVDSSVRQGLGTGTALAENCCVSNVLAPMPQIRNIQTQN